MLQRSEPIFEGSFILVRYSGEAGDMLAEHDHLFNHTMTVIEGEVEAFNSVKSCRRTVTDPPLEFPAGVRHGVRCITRSVFENRSPTLEFLAEQRAK